MKKYNPFLKKYLNSNKSLIMKKLNIKNEMQMPRIEKIVINNCLGVNGEDNNFLKQSIKDISLITGQKPLIIKSKKSISNFKIKKKAIIALKVTLRKDYMYDFLYRFINLCAPRIKDFKGFSCNSFDNRGNYNFGVKEKIIFPEIEFEGTLEKTNGYNISIVFFKSKLNNSKELLKFFGFPLRK